MREGATLPRDRGVGDVTQPSPRHGHSTEEVCAIPRPHKRFLSIALGRLTDPRARISCTR